MPVARVWGSMLGVLLDGDHGNVFVWERRVEELKSRVKGAFRL